MDEFFKDFAAEPCVISLKKMYEISQIVTARDESSGNCLLSFIETFSEIIEVWEDTREEYYDAPLHLRKELEDKLEIAQMKISLCVSVLTKYFYPIIEQLDATVNDGIKSESKFKKMREK